MCVCMLVYVWKGNNREIIWYVNWSICTCVCVHILVCMTACVCVFMYGHMCLCMCAGASVTNAISVLANRCQNMASFELITFPSLRDLRANPEECTPIYPLLNSAHLRQFWKGKSRVGAIVGTDSPQLTKASIHDNGCE